MNFLVDALAPLFAVAFTAWGAPVTWLEAVAVVISLATVWFNIRVDARTWPLAIAGSLLYFALFWKNRFYGNASLQLLFVAIAVWGWWQWVRGTAADGSALRVTWLSARARWLLVGLIAAAWPATALLLSATDSDVPWWDAFPTAASVVNQWLVGRKHVESWAVWIAVNVVSVSLFAYKALWPTAALYAVFIALSVAGWRAWARLADAPSATATP